MMHPSPDAKRLLLEATRRIPSPTRQQARLRTWLVLPAATLVGIAMYFAFDGPRHGGGRAPALALAGTMSWTVVAALSTWVALGREPAASWRSRAALMAVAAGTPGVLFVLMLAFGLMQTDPRLAHPEAIGFYCLGLTLAVGAVPLLLLLRIRRGSDPVHPATMGAALGSACGAFAGIFVEMWCPVARPPHVLLGHVLPIVVLALVGASLGPRALGMHPAAGAIGRLGATKG
jgi:hypothetical protein